MHQSQVAGNGICFVLDNALRRLHIGAVIAFRADGDGVFADGGKQHKLVGNAASHHAGIGSNGNHLGQSHPGVDALIGLVAFAVIRLQVRLAGMEGIGVLHGKFPHPDQPRPRPCFVAEFGLDLVYHKGVFRVALPVIPHKMNGGFLVGYAKHQGIAAAVVKARHLFADAFVSAGLLPQRGGHNHGELHFLAVNGVHFFPDDLFDFAGDSFQRRIGREDAVCHAFHIAASHHQSMAVHDAVGGLFPEPLSYKFVKFHNRIPPFLLLNTKKPQADLSSA